jgi:hypothetical protein
VCAMFLVEHWDTLLQLCHGVIQRFDTKSASSQIASANWALMHTPEIRADVELVVTYHDTFFFKHFEWLQRGDLQIGNRPGFISRHVGVRYYLMLTELDSWYDLDARGTEKWKTHDAFVKYRDIIASLPARASAPDQEPRTAQQVRIEQETKTNNFLMRARDSLVKHFSRWINEPLFLSL